MRIKQLISYPIPNELGMGNTHESYIRVENSLDVSDMFPLDEDVVVKNVNKSKTFSLKSKSGNEFRINQLGAIYQEYNVRPGDEIKFTLIENGNKTVFFSVKNYNRVFLSVTKKGTEIINIDRLNSFASQNNPKEYVVKINEGSLKLTFQKSEKKRIDSPSETDFYRTTVNDVELENGTYYITIQTNKNILEEAIKNRIEEYILDNEIDSMPSASVKTPLQQIFYGAPGTGKSHEIKKITGEYQEGVDTDVNKPNVFRTTFHPDTDYASFVGCYKPIMKEVPEKYRAVAGREEDIAYEFVPQTFTDAYVYAYNHSNEATYLVVEEINRGNCAQIFGDLFQLLDRNEKGESDYKIKADKDLAKYLEEGKNENGNDILQVKAGIKDGKLCLPSNLHILATMNTSDQSLFPIDSAFKRRWDWEYVAIDYEEQKSSAFTIIIDQSSYRWVDFIREVNKRIVDITQSEDKQMGNFFIKSSVNQKQFCSKVMFYLWNEILKDEVENTKYFFFEDKGSNQTVKFTFTDLYGDRASEVLNNFMKYLDVKNQNVDSTSTASSIEENQEDNE